MTNPTDSPTPSAASPAVQAPARSGPTLLGILSCLVFLGVAGTFSYLYWHLGREPIERWMDFPSPYSADVKFWTPWLIGATAAGLGLGFLGIRQSRKRRTLGFLGTVLNLATLAAFLTLSFTGQNMYNPQNDRGYFKNPPGPGFTPPPSATK